MTVAFLKQKGGVGKTTLALHLASEWVREGKRVVLIDADPQDSALDWSEQRTKEGFRRLFGVMGCARDTLHREAPEVARDADHVVIDGSALLAAGLLLIPAQPSPFDGSASGEMLKLVDQVRIFRPQLIARFVLNRCAARTAIAPRDGRGTAEHEPPVLAARVGQRISFADVARSERLVAELDPAGPVACEISAFALEVLKWRAWCHDGAAAEARFRGSYWLSRLLGPCARAINRPHAEHRVHSAADDRCSNASTARPYQDRGVSARPHRSRHAPRIARPRVPRWGRSRIMTAPAPDTLTHVELIWFEKRIEQWIRFGHDVAEQILDRRRRILRFAPGSIFAYVRWAANDFGTVVSRIDILRTVMHGEAFSTVPYVRPGGEILLRLSGWPKVECVLQAIDAVEQLGVDPADACPDHWRQLHNRLASGEPPRAYTADRHRAWLMRQRIDT